MNEKTRKTFYSSTFWKKKRAYWKKKNPLCEVCLKKGIQTPAKDIDHIEPWRNWTEFSQGKLQSICKNCHSEKNLTDHAHSARRRLTKIIFF